MVEVFRRLELHQQVDAGEVYPGIILDAWFFDSVGPIFNTLVLVSALFPVPDPKHNFEVSV